MIMKMTVLEFLSKLRKARKELDDTFKEYIDPESSTSRLMISIYNPYSNVNINGVDIDQVSKEIVSIDQKIKKTYDNLQKLLMIKEQINATCKLEVPSIDGNETMVLTIAQILVLKSDSVRKYSTQYLMKLRDDYVRAEFALKNHQKEVMAHDKVDKYVTTMLESLGRSKNLEIDKNSNAYQKYATEYMNANKMKIFDPLNIIGTIDARIDATEEFYRTIDYKLAEFNATTKIWYDLDKNVDFWGFVE